MFGIAVGNLAANTLAVPHWQVRVHSFEQSKSPKDISAKDRYLRIALKPQAIEQLLIDLFFNLSDPVPGRIFVDMDVTDDPVHGQQEQAFFNGYYNHECYAPLLIFLWSLAAKLRPSNVDPAGALELQRIVPQIQQRWPKTIIVRGDSAYARDEIMSWCEEHNVDYVGLPSNQRLQRMTHELESKPKLNSNAVKPLRLHCDPHPGFVPSPTAP